MQETTPTAALEALVRAIGSGFHPDTPGHDYGTLPEGYAAADVDRVIDEAVEAHVDVYEVALDVLTEMAATRHHVAKFHRAAWADSFAAAIAGPGWTATNIERKKGNVVEFDATVYPDSNDWADWALTVGYYGSPDNPGTLDGRRAIPCY